MITKRKFEEKLEDPNFKTGDKNSVGEYTEFMTTRNEFGISITPEQEVRDRQAFKRKEIDKRLAMGQTNYVLNSPGVAMDEKEAKQISKNYQFDPYNFQYPPNIEYIARQTGMSPFDVLNRVLKANGAKEVEPTPSIEASMEISPEFQTQINSVNTPEISTRAWGDSSTNNNGAFDPRIVPNNRGAAIEEIAGRTGNEPANIAAMMEASNAWDATDEQMVQVGDMSLNYAMTLNEVGSPSEAAVAVYLGNDLYQQYKAGTLDSAKRAEAEAFKKAFVRAQYKYGGAQTGALNDPSIMRTSVVGNAVPLTKFAPQVSSIVMERDDGQPGMDIFFEDKQFPAVLGGVVKEVGYQGNQSAGYGNYIVIESVDPATGEKVDVLYAHLASPSNLTEGSQVQPGSIIGTQGGTGSVRSYDGTIASIDFLAPAPKGSKSMTPYANYRQLRQSIAAQLRN